MSSLPPELYGSIAERADRKDLFNLAITSRLFQHEAERCLHREILIRFALSTRAVVILRRLLATPRFFPLIQRLKIHELRPGRRSDRAIRFSSFFLLFASAFRALTNLKILHFTIAEKRAHSWRSCGCIFWLCEFQLQYLRCSFPLDSSFVRFLEAQPGLVELYWEPWFGFPPSVKLPASTLPNLSVLTVSSVAEPAAYSFIKGRPITHLTWDIEPESERPGSTDHFMSFALSSVPIRALRDWCVQSYTVAAIPEYFPYLEYLSLVFCNLAEHRILDVLPQLRYLRAIEINPGDKDEATLAKTIHEACPTIKEIGAWRPFQSTLLEWDEEAMAWKSTQSKPHSERENSYMVNLHTDLWAESVHRAYPLLIM